MEAIMNVAGVTVCDRYTELDEFNLRKFQEKACSEVKSIGSGSENGISNPDEV